VAAGTGSDFGKVLGFRGQAAEYLGALTGGDDRVVDAGWARFTTTDGRSCRRHWINVLSAGIGGLVDLHTARAPAWLPGPLAYAQATVRAIVECRRVPLRCRALLADGRTVERKIDAYAVAVCNGTTFGAGMRVGPMALPDDGLFDVILFERVSKLRLVARLPTIYSGTHLHERGVSHFACRWLSLEPPRDTAAGDPVVRRGRAHRAAPRHGRDSSGSPLGLFPLDVDGDALGDVPLEVGILPCALRVCVPGPSGTSA
jgi:diacylglycerol kinase (ATP)